MANVIGQALIEVVSSGTGFAKSVEEETHTGLAAAETAAAESGTKIGTGMKSKFSSAFSGISTGAKLVMGAGLVEVFKSGYDKEKEYEQGLAQLQAGLKSTGGVSGMTAEEMEKLAEHVQGYSGQTSDSIVKTEQLLLTFTNIRNEAGKNNDIFTQTTTIAADMAAKLGTDASSAAIQLGKAMNDPVKGMTALTRVGVSFTQAQKDQVAAMVSSGNTMGAQKVILGELNKEFGGSAEAAGKTLPGQLNIAKNTFTDLAQSIIKDLVPVLNTVLGVFKAVAPVIGAVAPVIGPLVVAIIAIVGAVKAWTIAQELLNAVMEANPLALVLGALVLLAAGLDMAYKHSQTFRDIVQAAFHIVEAAAKFMIGVIMGAFHMFESAASAVIDFLKNHWQLIVIVLTGPIGIAVALLTKHWDKIVSTVKNAVSFVIDFVKNHWQLIVEILTGPIGIAVIFIIKHWNQISSTVQNVVHDVIGFFTHLVSFVAGLPGKIGSAASGMWDGIKAAFRDAIDWIIRGWNSLHFKIPGVHAGPFHIGGFTLGLPQIPLLATGGNFNGLAIAGEFGPELIAGQGKVFNRTETQKMLGGSSIVIHPGAFQVNIQGSADKDMVKQALDEWSSGLAQTLRRRGVVMAG